MSWPRTEAVEAMGWRPLIPEEALLVQPPLFWLEAVRRPPFHNKKYERQRKPDFEGRQP